MYLIKYIKNGVLLLTMVLLIAGCSKKKDPALPAKAVLSFPAQNALCTSGTVISDTQTSVILSWAVAANTDSYEITVKNLLTNTTSIQTSNTNKVTVTLLRGTPYSWFVTSRSNATIAKAQSDTWKFYVAGAGITSYVPFPATLTSPVFGENITTTTGKIDLLWAGSDVDNDIVNYDVYLGKSPTNLSLLLSNYNYITIDGVNVSSDNTYYWKVVTRDSQGNTSDSDTFWFKVK